MAHLSSVGKVAELGFPDDQAVGVLQGIAQLKAQGAVLAQVAVADGELTGGLHTHSASDQLPEWPFHTLTGPARRLMGGSSTPSPHEPPKQTSRAVMMYPADLPSSRQALPVISRSDAAQSEAD